jgi:hypothetical protein
MCVDYVCGDSCVDYGFMCGLLPGLCILYLMCVDHVSAMKSIYANPVLFISISVTVK